MGPSNYRVDNENALISRLAKINHSLALSAHQDNPSWGGWVWSKVAGKTMPLEKIQKTLMDNETLLNQPSRPVYLQLQALSAKILTTYDNSKQREDLLNTINDIMTSRSPPSSKEHSPDPSFDLVFPETQLEERSFQIPPPPRRSPPPPPLNPISTTEESKIPSREEALKQEFSNVEEEVENVGFTSVTLDEPIDTLPLLAKETKLLDIKNWKMGYFPAQIYDLKQLKMLMFGFENRQPLNLQLAPKQWSKLQSLSIRNAFFINIPPELGKLPSLTSVYFVSSEILRLDLRSLPQIKHLSFYATPLGTLPPSIAHLKNLTELTCTGCYLTHLPNEVGALTNLENLDITRNPDLVGLPTTLGDLTHLKEIKCDAVHIPYLPPSLANCKALEQIVLADDTIAWSNKGDVTLEEFLQNNRGNQGQI